MERWGPCPSRPGHIGSGGIIVDISNSCAACALSSPLCPGAFGQPGLGRRLCGGDPGGAGPGSQNSGHHRVDPHRALSAVHQNLEFGRAQRQTWRVGQQPAGRASSRPDRADAAPGISAGGAGRAFGRRCRQGARYRRTEVARTGRGVGPRTRRRDRHRRADHRGRDLHRARSRGPGGRPRPSRARRRAHP